MLWTWTLIAFAAVIAIVVVIVILRRRSANRGPVSIVMLRPAPRALTESEVRHAVRLAVGVTAEVQVLPVDPGVATGFIVTSDQFPPIAVVVANRTYCEPEDVDEVSSRLEDPDVRRAYADHGAWISVDAMGLDRLPKRPAREVIYNRLLGKVAAQLLDDGCSLLHLPVEGLIAKPSGSAAELLAGDRVFELFSDEDTNTPVFGVAKDDSRVNAAIEKARVRLPEFVSAFERLGQRSEAMVKGAFRTSSGDNEYMWVKVQSASDSALCGELVNRPMHVPLLSRGQTVSVPLEDVVDWAYLDESGRPHGMFVERIIRKG